MKRITATFPITDIDTCKEQMLSWCNRFNICSFLDNHHYDSVYQRSECLAAAGSVKIFSSDTYSFEAFSAAIVAEQDWLFGNINYDVKKNSVAASLPSPIGFPDFFFFLPETVLQLKDGLLTISCLGPDPNAVYESICSSPALPLAHNLPVSIRSRITKEEYIQAVKKILAHIQRGDCYELNYCQEFFAENVAIDPLAVYRQLTSLSPNPFSCFYRLNDKYVLCASPERYLQKKGNRIISQPIKGTRKRNSADPVEDDVLKSELQNSSKDKAENVMVVDLVRNDLSMICREGSVVVDELYGIYSFPQVHQMVSTISGELVDGIGFAEIINASFPMGSMTGAPKKRVMELIAEYEATKRGIYSGALGYISPDQDFDFNVVIRSIFYNATNQYLSYLVGGGITFYSDPEKEYEECLVKATAIQQVLHQ